MEIYRRAVRAYRNLPEAWRVCLEGATNSVQIEMDL